MMNSDTRLQVSTYLLGQLIGRGSSQGIAAMITLAVTAADALDQELNGEHEPADIYKHSRRRAEEAEKHD